MTAVRPLIVHVVYGFHTGGLENGIVNLINRISPGAFRHAVVSLTTRDQSFCRRIERDDVEFFDLHKPPGHGVKLYPALFRLFRRLRPAIVHTRNLAALEAVVPARLARVPVTIHGEHGWDVSDPQGTRRKFKLMRRLYSPFVSHYVALSTHIETYLAQGVGIASSRITRICNGVDTDRFRPNDGGRGDLRGSPFDDRGLTVIGTVGRLQPIKDQANLVRAFARLVQQHPASAANARLMIVGEGSLRAAIESELAGAGIADKVWLAGERSDIPDAMRAMDIFVLPSRAEGISNTILEAMASGLPVVATAVGGNAELILDGETGALVPPSDPIVLADALKRYLDEPDRVREQGRAARCRAEAEFSLAHMVDAYEAVYRGQLARISA